MDHSFVTPEIINTIIISIVVLALVFIVVKSPIFQTSMLKKSKKLTDSYIHELEDDIVYYKKLARKSQLKQNVNDRGPQIKDGEWSNIVPEIINGLSPFIPKKLQPLFEDKEISGAIIEKVLKDPAKYKEIIKSFISKSKTNTATEADGQSV